MLLTRRPSGDNSRPLRAELLLVGYGLLVTGCGNVASVGGLAAAGSQSTAPGNGGSESAQARSATAGAPGGTAAAWGGDGGLEADPPAAGHAAAGGTSGAGASAGTAAAAGGLVSAPKQYPGQGFIVHEWGTDTVVVGSDGSLQRGLHHEEEDLPSFVYDRIKAGTLLAARPSPSVTIKMETPVTYFYSPTALPVSARVEFPKGVLTQWYPGVASFLPPLAAADSRQPHVPAVLSDLVFDPSFPFVSEMCRAKLGSVSGGRLDWGSFSVRARESVSEEGLPDAPLSQFGWSHARAVAANLLEMPNGERERFLFYRGLGNFDLPVKLRAEESGKVLLSNGYGEAVSRVFLLNVDAQHGAFVVHSEGIAAGATLEVQTPSLDGALAIDEYVQRLSDAVTRALDDTGLYHDEAVAMVNTWRRQWFRTPGIRALYLLPQSWTEQSIPLVVTPTPDATVRVMLIRVELISKQQEAADAAALSTFDADPSLGQAHFSALGRFAEPRLRRALQLVPSAAGEQYLAQIASAQSNVMSGE